MIKPSRNKQKLDHSILFILLTFWTFDTNRGKINSYTLFGQLS